MSGSTLSSSENSFDQLENQFSNLITQRVIQKASAIIQMYNGETDAILLSESLCQVKSMLHELKKTQYDPNDIRKTIILEEFQRRWMEIDYIISKARKGRPKPILTRTDAQNAESIRRDMNALFGNNTLPTEKILPFLLGAAKK
ncbi:MAG: hypothetical protein IKI69_08740 [Oscillospiraceae bacterium]|nr:hypothetical protein [Oscillospiraceae bacterium]